MYSHPAYCIGFPPIIIGIQSTTFLVCPTFRYLLKVAGLIFRNFIQLSFESNFFTSSLLEFLSITSFFGDEVLPPIFQFNSDNSCLSFFRHSLYDVPLNGYGTYSSSVSLSSNPITSLNISSNIGGPKGYSLIGCL